MTRTTSPTSLAIVAALACTLAACEAEKSESPLSPSVAGPIAGVEITPPGLVEPSMGGRYKDSQQPIRLTVQNASSNGVRPLYYTFEVAADEGFVNKVFARGSVPPGGDGRTSVQIDRLEIGRIYFWRVRAEDGANTGAFLSAQFELMPKPFIGPPALLSPVNNEVAGSLQPTLRVGNADRNSAVGGLFYEFQVASNQAFTALTGAAQVGEGAGQTSAVVAPALPNNATQFWRARATDGESFGDWSATQVFRTPNVVAPPPPGPPPPGPAPGGLCTGTNPEAIVACERAKWGHMSHNDMFAFMRSVAQSMNRNGISGGPFGILRKESGANCNGYSCDILCAGQGNSQRQWDVLGDIDGAQSPGWRGPLTVPGIRVDVCEIQ